MDFLKNFLHINNSCVNYSPKRTKIIACAVLAAIFIYGQSNAINFGSIFSFFKKTNQTTISKPMNCPQIGGTSIANFSNPVNIAKAPDSLNATNLAKKSFFTPKTAVFATCAVVVSACALLYFRKDISKWFEDRKEAKRIAANKKEKKRIEKELFKMFCIAAKTGDIDTIKRLLFDKNDEQKKKLLNATLDDKQTPLHLAALYGHAEIVEILIENGANIEARDIYNWTPLHWAVYNGHAEIVEILIESGANIEARDDTNQTPLHWAVYIGHAKIVEILIESGADIEAKDNDNQTPLHWAANNIPIECASLCIEFAKTITESDAGTNVINLYTKVIKILIESDANIEARDNENKTPLDKAKNNHKILYWLNLASHYKQAEDKKQCILDKSKKLNTPEDKQDFEFLIKLAFNSSIKENKTQIKETVFGQLYDKEKGLGRELLADTLNIQLPKGETTNILKFIEMVAQENNFFLPKDLRPENFIISRFKLLMQQI